MKKLVSLSLIILSIVLFSLSISSAQEIKVYIDGKQLFFDVPPAAIGGRILVPLRTIFEGLGASVEYNSSKKLISSQKNNIKVELTLDSTSAYVNNQLRILEVPATSKYGRTLVPLRFIGEAFKATVKWESNSQSVFIDTSTMANSVPSPQEINKPVIYSITHNIEAPVITNAVIEVTMDATPGGKAYFAISNVIKNVPMEEKEKGIYKGTYTVRAGDFVNNGVITGYLAKDNKKASKVEAQVKVTINPK